MAGIAFGIGVAAGATLISFRTPAPVADTISPELREKFQKLTDTELEEYYQLKSSQEKFQKADEILGKIMKIFLADLGLHVSPHSLHASSDSAAPQSKASELSAPMLSVPLAAARPTLAEEAIPSRNISLAETQLTSLRNEREVEGALANVKLADFDKALQTSTRFANPTLLKKLNGSFSGQASVTSAGRHHIWDVTIDLQATIVKDHLDGSCTIKLSENGKVFSTSKGSGEQSGFREMPADAYAMLIRVSPTTSFQLYYLNDLDRLAGNIYQREAEDRPYEYSGTVMLTKN